MKAQYELARIDGLGNIARFPCGRVMITIPGISLHLTEDAFVLFADMVMRAKNRYMDNSLMDMMKERDET